jgi:superfamily I DNA/RNA helicase
LAIRSEISEAFDDPETWIVALFDDALWAPTSTIDRDDAVADLKLARDKALAILESERENSPELGGIDLLRGVARTLRYQIATREPFESETEANITVSTLWGAKGVTADHVYILGLFNEALPGHRRSEYPGTDDEYFEEQRRLFYVSITRAKETMFLSRPLKINRNEAARLGIELTPGPSPWPIVEASPFLLEILAFLPSAEDGEAWT